MKLLLISDESFSVNNGGFSQTMYNVFSFITPENFLFVTLNSAYKGSEPEDIFTKRTVTYKLQLIPAQRNRLGKYVNKLINRVNYSINYKLRSFKKLRSIIQNFNPDAVVVAPNKEEGLFMYFKLKPVLQNKKVFPYFMDDWLRNSGLSWFGGNIQFSAKQLFAENTAWLMISKNLADVFKNRYGIMPQRVLEVHNPVDVTDLPELKPLVHKDEYIFVYAGSIWQMHFDSLLIMAKAIKCLKQKRKLRLIVYTSQEHWEWRRGDLIPLDVEYGGFIPYKNIHQKLEAADFLILTSTFDKDLFIHSASSIQTKITDYLKAGRAIVSCGPSYSVNHKFLKQYNCGICIETQDEKRISEKLNDILQSPGEYYECISNGFDALTNEFCFEKVHQKLDSFLNDETINNIHSAVSDYIF